MIVCEKHNFYLDKTFNKIQCKRCGKTLEDLAAEVFPASNHKDVFQYAKQEGFEKGYSMALNIPPNQ